MQEKRQYEINFLIFLLFLFFRPLQLTLKILDGRKTGRCLKKSINAQKLLFFFLPKTYLLENPVKNGGKTMGQIFLFTICQKEKENSILTFFRPYCLKPPLAP